MTVTSRVPTPRPIVLMRPLDLPEVAEGGDGRDAEGDPRARDVGYEVVAVGVVARFRRSDVGDDLADGDAGDCTSDECGGEGRDRPNVGCERLLDRLHDRGARPDVRGEVDLVKRHFPDRRDVGGRTLVRVGPQRYDG